MTRIKRLYDQFHSYLLDPLRKNAIFLIINNMGMAVLSFIFWVIATRYASETVIGLASTILSIIGLLVSLSSLGLGMAMIRFLPENEKDGRSALINSSLIITSIIALFIGMIYILGVSFWTPKLLFLYSTPFLLIGIVALIIIRLISTLTNSVFISYRASKYVFIKETALFHLIKIVIIPFLIVFGVIGILISWGIALVLSLIFSIIILIQKFHYKPSTTLEIERIKPLFSFAVGNYISGLLASLPSFLLPVILINLLSPVDTAHFYVAWMIGNILFTLPGNIGMSLFAEGSQNIQDFRSNIKKSINFILLITIPAIIIFWLFGANILLLFGDEYSTEGLTLLRTLAISTVPLIGISIFITIKRVEKRTKEMICAQGIIAILTLGVTYVFAPTYGIVSAGIGWIVSLCIALLFIACLSLYNRIKIRGLANEDTPY